jgi:fatty acid CoA ligase FadD9
MDDQVDHGPAVHRVEELYDQDPVLRDLRPDPNVLRLLREGQHSAIDILASAYRQYADRPCLGERERIFETDAEGRSRARWLPSFRTITYAALWTRVQALAAGWSATGRVRAGDFVANCGFASIDFVVVDLACLYLGAISVPLQTSTSPEALAAIVAETGLKYLACSSAHLDIVEAASPELTVLVTELDPADRDTNSRVAALGTRRVVDRLVDLERAGAARDVPAAKAAPEQLVSILYTSGTTGAPKGVMYADRVFVHRLSYALFEPPIPWITVGSLPLNHVTGRFSVHRAALLGGLTHFVADPDMSTLFDDIRLVRPTQLMLVPRVTAIVQQHFQAELVRGGGGDARARVMAEMRTTFLGDRLCLLHTGSASTPPETLAFLRECFGISVVELYGFNEFGAVANDWRIVPGVDYKLVDVPELGYSVHDRPYPRGELLVRSRYATLGYFKHPAANANLVDEDGFFHSNDVMEERGPRHVVWIDRKTNVVKLSQGVFVGLARLEDLFVARSSYIAQVYLYASSQQPYLLGVIVPDAELAQSIGAVGDDALRRLLRSELMRIAETAALPSHEVPRDFLIERTPFGAEAGLLTESGKLRRAGLKAAYAERLEALYAEHDRRQVELATRATSGTVPERVIALVTASLGVEQIDPTQSFVQLGGDSFGALRLSTLITQQLGASPQVGSLLDPLLSVHELGRRVQEQHQSPGRTRYDEIHGDDEVRLHAAALRLDRFLPRALIEQAAARRAPTTPPRSVLLTGAAGFLGRFLLLELLERGAARGGRVVCVVRAPDDAAARVRVERALLTADTALRERFIGAASAGRLEVRAGDLTRERFGLPDRVYDAWSEEIDAVVHNGALVNHAFTYAQLFEPNVGGAAEALRFALERKTKSAAFVSSSALAVGIDREVTERDTAEALWPTRPVVSEGGPYGYVTSKWASELLFADAQRGCGVPVQIFRCGMITAHRQYLGQVNDGDNVTRLLRGLLWTGVAPRSFYGEDVSDPHFDGVAVDVVAGGIAAIALEAASGQHLYHVSNAHRRDDRVSLDTLADSIAAERPLQRFADRARWLDEFRVRLEALDAPQRRRSPLANLARWKQPEPAGLRLDNRAFRDRLAQLLGMNDVPPLDADYVAWWLRGLTTSD